MQNTTPNRLAFELERRSGNTHKAARGLPGGLLGELPPRGGYKVTVDPSQVKVMKYTTVSPVLGVTYWSHNVWECC